MTENLIHTLALSLLLVSAPAIAQPLNKDQQKCVVALNGGLTKVDQAVAKQISACLKNNAKANALNNDDPEIDTIEECVVDDPKGKIQKAKDKTSDGFAKKCTTLRPFGPKNAESVNDAGLQRSPGLVHDLFGPDLDASALIREAADKSAANCQAQVWKSVTKCAQTMFKEFATCKKLGLKAETIVDSETLERVCLAQDDDPDTGQPDEKGKIAKACTDAEKGIALSLAKKCDGQDIDALFPGCASSSDAAACLDQKTECRVCLTINEADGTSRDCDRFDDGAANGSCPPDACIFLPDGATCDDGDTGTEDDQCAARTCSGQSIPPACLGAPVGAACSGHGQCDLQGSTDISNAVCVCDIGYVGETCDFECPGFSAPWNFPPKVCAGRGACVVSPGANAAHCVCNDDCNCYGAACQFLYGSPPDS